MQYTRIRSCARISVSRNGGENGQADSQIAEAKTTRLPIGKIVRNKERIAEWYAENVKMLNVTLCNAFFYYFCKYFLKNNVQKIKAMGKME